MNYQSVKTKTGDFLVPYEFKRSRKAKNIKLSVGWKTQIILTVPWNISYDQALDFLKQQGDWIQKQLGKTQRAESISEFYMKQPYWYAYAKKWRLEIVYKGKQARVAEMSGRRIEIKINREKNMDDQLMVVTRSFAAKALKHRTSELAEYTGLVPNAIRVGNQATRWGSCSSNRTISLNWRLILIPARLQDHIILHELAHIKEMNHSKSFYQLLEQLDANTHQHNLEIKDLGSKIMRLGRS